MIISLEENPNELKALIKIIYDMNQDIKNVYQSKSFYNWENGVIISYNQTQMPQYVETTINYNKAQSKLDLDKILGDKNFTIYSKMLFDFYKNYKSNIIAIDIESNNYIEFVTNLKGTSLKFMYQDNCHNNYLKKISELKGCEDSIPTIFKLDEDNNVKIQEFNNEVFSIVFDFDTGRCNVYKESDRVNLNNYLKIILNKKFMVGLKNKVLKTKSNISTIDNHIFTTSVDNLYILESTVINENYNSKQINIIVDIEE